MRSRAATIGKGSGKAAADPPPKMSRIFNKGLGGFLRTSVGAFWGELASVYERARRIFAPGSPAPQQTSRDQTSHLKHASPERADFSLKVCTANVSGWGSARTWIREHTSAHVICLQEHHLRSKEDLDQASAWALRQGWKSFWVSALPGDGSGTRGGVAILARHFLGLHALGHHELVYGRAIGCIVQIPGGTSFAISSVYLQHGTGLDDHNSGVLAKAGQFVTTSGLPWLIGGDFNLEPPAIASSEFLDITQGTLLYPDVVGTCTTTGGVKDERFVH